MPQVVNKDNKPPLAPNKVSSGDTATAEVSNETRHTQNLAILRDFLLSNDLPFEMKDYRTIINNPWQIPFTKDQVDAGVEGCGTAGCALGWAPFVIPVEAQFLGAECDGSPYILMAEYCKDVFGIEHNGSDPFVFCFDSLWSRLDNSRLGAAYRINELITSGPMYELFKQKSRYNSEGLEDYEQARDEWLATVEHS